MKHTQLPAHQLLRKAGIIFLLSVYLSICLSLRVSVRPCIHLSVCVCKN